MDSLSLYRRRVQVGCGRVAKTVEFSFASRSRGKRVAFADGWRDWRGSGGRRAPITRGHEAVGVDVGPAAVDEGPMKPIVGRPGSLIASVIAVQAVVLAVGWLLVYGATHERVAAGVSETLLEYNRLVAAQVQDAIGPLPERRDASDPAWRRAQRVVSDARLANGGFVCILDKDGRPISHPQIDSPFFVDTSLDERTFTHTDGAPLTLGMARGIGQAGGVVDMGIDGRHYVFLRQDSATGSSVLVHQPVSGLSGAVASVTAGMLVRAALVGGLVVGVSAASLGVLLRRHTRAMRAWTAELERQVAVRTMDVRRSREAIVLALAKVTEYRDNETGRHVERIGETSRLLAQRLIGVCPEIDAAWVERLALASTLHDIGKVAVPDAVLRKPGPLTPEEAAQIRRHPTVGADTLIAVHRELEKDPLVAMAVEICLYHHERWDGTGYPVGLRGEEIPLSARIVAVADVFDALLSARAYKPPMPLDRAVGMIRAAAGAHFDPAVVDALLGCLPELCRVREANADGAATDIGAARAA